MLRGLLVVLNISLFSFLVFNATIANASSCGIMIVDTSSNESNIYTLNCQDANDLMNSWGKKP